MSKTRAQYLKDWRGRNPAKQPEYNRRRKELAQQFAAWCKAIGCQHCGEPDALVLEFAHRKGSFPLRDGKGRRKPLFATLAQAVFLAELQKCLVLCANCHLRYDTI